MRKAGRILDGLSSGVRKVMSETSRYLTKIESQIRRVAVHRRVVPMDPPSAALVYSSVITSKGGCNLATSLCIYIHAIKRRRTYGFASLYTYPLWRFIVDVDLFVPAISPASGLPFLPFKLYPVANSPLYPLAKITCRRSAQRLHIHALRDKVLVTGAKGVRALTTELRELQAHILS